MRLFDSDGREVDEPLDPDEKSLGSLNSVLYGLSEMFNNVKTKIFGSISLNVAEVVKVEGSVTATLDKEGNIETTDVKGEIAVGCSKIDSEGNVSHTISTPLLSVTYSENGNISQTALGVISTNSSGDISVGMSIPIAIPIPEVGDVNVNIGVKKVYSGQVYRDASSKYLEHLMKKRGK